MYIVVTTYDDDSQEVHAFYNKEAAIYHSNNRYGAILSVTVWKTTNRSMCAAAGGIYCRKE